MSVTANVESFQVHYKCSSRWVAKPKLRYFSRTFAIDTVNQPWTCQLPNVSAQLYHLGKQWQLSTAVSPLLGLISIYSLCTATPSPKRNRKKEFDKFCLRGGISCTQAHQHGITIGATNGQSRVSELCMFRILTYLP